LRANSQAICADIMGLRGNATAIPVEKCRVGAAMAAVAMTIQGTWLLSVINIPEKPLASNFFANSAASDQVEARAMRSNSTMFLHSTNGFLTT